MKIKAVIALIVFGAILIAGNAWAKKYVYWFTAPTCIYPGTPTPYLCTENPLDPFCHLCDRYLYIWRTSDYESNFTIRGRALVPPNKVIYRSAPFFITENPAIYNLYELFPAFSLIEIVIETPKPEPSLKMIITSPDGNYSFEILPIRKK